MGVFDIFSKKKKLADEKDEALIDRAEEEETKLRMSEFENDSERMRMEQDLINIREELKKRQLMDIA
jgi:hypothetical protein